MRRALVLGGGGFTGIAWETGVLMGLKEAGVNIRDWDLVVGTSAGSIVGAKVLGEPEFEVFFGSQVMEAGPEDDLPIRLMSGRLAAAILRLGRRRGLGWMPRFWVFLYAIETLVRQRVLARHPAGASEPPRPALRRFTPPDPRLAALGAFGVAARTGSEAIYRQIMEAALDPVKSWPRNLVVTTIDVHTGEAVALDGASGVPFVDAIAASCAVPTFMPMMTIEGRRYMDGGMASQTHAELAHGYDEVFIIAPLDLGALGVELEALRGSGSRVTVVSPDAASRRAIGRNVALLDPARRARAAQAGLLDGRRAAAAAAAASGTPTGRARLAGSEG